MTIPNFSLINQAIEDILQDNIPEVIVRRNAETPKDPSQAASRDAWIGVYRGRRDYAPHTTGATPFLVDYKPWVFVMAGSYNTEEDAEESLLAMEQKVMVALKANLKLNGTVAMTNGYSVDDYEFEPTKGAPYYSAVIITLNTQLRA